MTDHASKDEFGFVMTLPGNCGVSVQSSVADILESIANHIGVHPACEEALDDMRRELNRVDRTFVMQTANAVESYLEKHEDEDIHAICRHGVSIIGYRHGFDNDEMILIRGVRSFTMPYNGTGNPDIGTASRDMAVFLMNANIIRQRAVRRTARKLRRIALFDEHDLNIVGRPSKLHIGQYDLDLDIKQSYWSSITQRSLGEFD